MTDGNTEIEMRDPFEAQRVAIIEKFLDAEIPGAIVEFDPIEAEAAGAFVEDALSESDAADSTEDLLEVDNG